MLLILYSLNVNRENDHDLKLFLTVCKSCINIDVLIFDQKKSTLNKKNIHKKALICAHTVCLYIREKIKRERDYMYKYVYRPLLMLFLLYF